MGERKEREEWPWERGRRLYKVRGGGTEVQGTEREKETSQEGHGG